MIHDKYLKELDDMIFVGENIEKGHVDIDGICNELMHECPYCHCYSLGKNGYGYKKIKDIPLQNHSVTLNIKNQRWKCSCKKSSWSPMNFVQDYHMITKRLYSYVVTKALEFSPKSIAEECNLSKRNVNMLIEEYSDDKFHVFPSTSLLLVESKIDNIHIYYLLNLNVFGLKKTFDTFESAAKHLTSLDKSKCHKLCIQSLYPEDSKIQLALLNKIPTVTFDYRTYRTFVTEHLFRVYKQFMEGVVNNGRIPLRKKDFSHHLKTELTLYRKSSDGLDDEDMDCVKNITKGINPYFIQILKLKNKLLLVSDIAVILDSETPFLSLSAATSYSGAPTKLYFSSILNQKVIDACDCSLLGDYILDHMQNHDKNNENLDFPESSINYNDISHVIRLDIELTNNVSNLVKQINHDINIIHPKMLLYKYQLYPNPSLQETYISNMQQFEKYQ